MRQIHTFDVKNRLSELLNAVHAGETIEILRRGKAIARLTPIPTENAQFASRNEAIEWIMTHRKSIVSIDELCDMVDEGKR